MFQKTLEWTNQSDSIKWVHPSSNLVSTLLCTTNDNMYYARMIISILKCLHQSRDDYFNSLILTLVKALIEGPYFEL
jgi:hypothetical protein